MNKKSVLALSVVAVIGGVVFMAYRGYQLGQWFKKHMTFFRYFIQA